MKIENLILRLVLTKSASEGGGGDGGWWGGRGALPPLYHCHLLYMRQCFLPLHFTQCPRPLELTQPLVVKLTGEVLINLELRGGGINVRGLNRSEIVISNN